MIKYEVVGCNYGLVLREYKNKYSAFNYARKFGYPCFVRSFNSSNGEYNLIREYL